MIVIYFLLVRTTHESNIFLINQFSIGTLLILIDFFTHLSCFLEFFFIWRDIRLNPVNDFEFSSKSNSDICSLSFPNSIIRQIVSSVCQTEEMVGVFLINE